VLTLLNRAVPSRRGLALALTLAAGLALGPIGPSRAARMTSDIKLDADDLNHPIVLDQNGAKVAMPTKDSGPVTLAAGTVPSYIAYTVDGDDTLPRSVHSIHAGAAKAWKTGPLHLDAVVQGKLDSELAQYGKVAVHTRSGTYLVRPLAPVFGGGTGGAATGRAWLANLASAASKSPAASTSSTTPATGAQTLTPPRTTATTATTPTAYGANYVVRDLSNLFHVSAGKFSNMNKASLNRLARDLGISVPKDVTTHPAVRQPARTTTTAAQMLDPADAAGTAQPAPIPEPGTLAFFGLALGAWGVRRGLKRRAR
jgi:hypothetical protein